MHFPCLVVGDDVGRQLEPFSDHLKVPRYRQFLDTLEIDLMSRHFGISPTDLLALGERMSQWRESEGGVKNDRLFAWSTSNPSAKYDWYKVGGGFADYLHLKEPIQPGLLRRLAGAKPATRAAWARRSNVNEDLLRAEPPPAFVLQGQWEDCPISADEPTRAAWGQRFCQLLDSVDANALLTVIDVHS